MWYTIYTMPQQKTTATQSLSSLISELTRRDIFDILGAHTIPEEEREEYLETMLETIMDRVFVRIIDACPEDQCQKINEALHVNDRDVLNDLLFANGLPDFDAMVAEETIVYKFEMYSLFQEE